LEKIRGISIDLFEFIDFFFAQGRVQAPDKFCCFHTAASSGGGSNLARFGLRHT
jgi:hypothetical protein